MYSVHAEATFLIYCMHACIRDYRFHTLQAARIAELEKLLKLYEDDNKHLQKSNNVSCTHTVIL